MDHPVPSAARVWSASVTTCASYKDAYLRGVFLADGRAAMLKVGGKWHLSRLFCHVRTALVCKFYFMLIYYKYFMLNCGDCSEEKDRAFPRPKHPPTTLVFPFPYQPASHLCYVGLAYSSSLGWAVPLQQPLAVTGAPSAVHFPHIHCHQQNVGKPWGNHTEACLHSALKAD